MKKVLATIFLMLIAHHSYSQEYSCLQIQSFNDTVFDFYRLYEVLDTSDGEMYYVLLDVGCVDSSLTKNGYMCERWSNKTRIFFFDDESCSKLEWLHPRIALNDDIIIDVRSGVYPLTPIRCSETDSTQVISDYQELGELEVISECK